MKRSALRAGPHRGLLIGILFMCSSCSPHLSRSHSNLYRLPWNQEDGSYALQEVEIESIEDARSFSGPAARVVVEPTSANGELQAGEPVGRWIVDSRGVNIPSDFVSLQAFTIYAHAERLKKLDESMGLAQVTRWPALYALDSHLIDASSGEPIYNNALYKGDIDALLLVPFTNSKEVPIAVNAGILAHEHFHKIFQAKVLNKLSLRKETMPQAKADVAAAHDCGILTASWSRSNAPPLTRGLAAGRAAAEEAAADGTDGDGAQVLKAADAIGKTDYNIFFLRGLNEGLADFWGWVYSGDADFIGKSLRLQESVERRLDVQSSPLLSDIDIRLNLLSEDLQLRPEGERVQLAYLLVGTYYARALRDLVVDLSGSDKPTRDDRLKVARAVLNSLDDIAQMSSASLEKSFISSHRTFEILVSRLSNLNIASCARLARFTTMKPVKIANCPTIPSAAPLETAAPVAPAAAVTTEAIDK